MNWWAGTKIVEKVGGHKQLSRFRCIKEIKTKFKKINYTLIFLHYLSVLKVVTVTIRSKGDD